VKAKVRSRSKLNFEHIQFLRANKNNCSMLYKAGLFAYSIMLQ